MDGGTAASAIRHAEIGGGATWSDAAAPSRAFHAVGGGCVSVSAAGGWLQGGPVDGAPVRHGRRQRPQVWSCSRTAARSSRTRARARALLGAARWGGGTFGVVTSVAHRLHAVEPIVSVAATTPTRASGRPPRLLDRARAAPGRPLGRSLGQRRHLSALRGQRGRRRRDVHRRPARVGRRPRHRGGLRVGELLRSARRRGCHQQRRAHAADGREAKHCLAARAAAMGARQSHGAARPRPVLYERLRDGIFSRRMENVATDATAVHPAA